MYILTAIRELSDRHESFKKIATIEMTTGATSKLLENLTAMVHHLVLDVGQHKEALKCIDGEIQSLKEENKSLAVWLLKLHGVREKGEDIRMVAIDICG